MIEYDCTNVMVEVIQCPGELMKQFSFSVAGKFLPKLFFDQSMSSENSTKKYRGPTSVLHCFAMLGILTLLPHSQ